MRIMPECDPQVNSKSLDPLFIYALTHTHSRIGAIYVILAREGGYR